MITSSENPRKRFPRARPVPFPRCVLPARSKYNPARLLRNKTQSCCAHTHARFMFARGVSEHIDDCRQAGGNYQFGTYIDLEARFRRSQSADRDGTRTSRRARGPPLYRRCAIPHFAATSLGVKGSVNDTALRSSGNNSRRISYPPGGSSLSSHALFH